MRITFTRDEIYETEGPGKGPAFPAGSTWDCAEEFALRWVARKAAEVVGPQTPKGGERYVEVKSGRKADKAAATEAAGPDSQGGADSQTDAEAAQGSAGDDSLTGGAGQDQLNLGA